MADDKYIIRPGGLNDKSDNNGPDKEPYRENLHSKNMCSPIAWFNLL